MSPASAGSEGEGAGLYLVRQTRGGERKGGKAELVSSLLDLGGVVWQWSGTCDKKRRMMTPSFGRQSLCECDCYSDFVRYLYSGSWPSV